MFLRQVPNVIYSKIAIQTLLHYKKNKQLGRAYCGGCKNSRYRPPTAARFRPVTVHEIYCGRPIARRNSHSICGVL